jgi:FkbM family methyltransferase
VGANVGVFSMFFSRQVGPQGRVVAFEPNPRNFITLERNLALNHIHNVLALRLALGAARSQRAAYALAGRAGTTTFAAGAPGDDARYVPVGTLAIAPLDEVVAERALPLPQWVKIDVEGAELEVLDGGARVLRQARPKLFLELHGEGPQHKANHARQLLDWLQNLGYQAVHVETGAAIRSDGFVPGVGHWMCQPEAAGDVG